MGVLVWTLEKGQWYLSYANEKAGRFLNLELFKGLKKLADPFLDNLGQIDLKQTFDRVLSTRLPQELVIRHGPSCSRAHVHLKYLNTTSVLSYYLDVSPLIRKENELKMMVNQLNQFNRTMIGKEAELTELQQKVKTLEFKLNTIKNSVIL